MRKFLLLLIYSMLGCGCLFSPQKDNSRFYALGFKELGATDNSCNNGKKVVHVDLEEIPAYADVSQFVSLKDGCEILRSELLRWGEPFKTSVSRSLYIGLSSRLKGKYSVVMLPVRISQECEYRVNVRVTNFIFNHDKKEIYLNAAITILKHGKLHAICDYNDCVKVNSLTPKAIVHGMDWALNAMSVFIGQCLDVVPTNKTKSDSVSESKVSSQIETNVQGDSHLAVSGAPCRAIEDPRTIELVAHGEVYVIVDSEDGNVRYFSGRLYDGSSVKVQCDRPFKVISTNDSLLEVK